MPATLRNRSAARKPGSLEVASTWIRPGRRRWRPGPPARTVGRPAGRRLATAAGGGDGGARHRLAVRGPPRRRCPPRPGRPRARTRSVGQPVRVAHEVVAFAGVERVEPGAAVEGRRCRRPSPHAVVALAGAHLVGPPPRSAECLRPDHRAARRAAAASIVTVSSRSPRSMCRRGDPGSRAAAPARSRRWRRSLISPTSPGPGSIPPSTVRSVKSIRSPARRTVQGVQRRRVGRRVAAPCRRRGGRSSAPRRSRRQGEQRRRRRRAAARRFTGGTPPSRCARRPRSPRSSRR